MKAGPVGPATSAELAAIQVAAYVPHHSTPQRAAHVSAARISHAAQRAKAAAELELEQQRAAAELEQQKRAQQQKQKTS